MRGLTVEFLRDRLNYDPKTGIFTRKVTWHNKLAGSATGNIYANGYVRVSVGCKAHSAHRLAWFYVYGVEPSGEIDHINGIRDDNRIENLRDLTPSQNQQNRRSHSKCNKSGYLGVSWAKNEKKWRSSIHFNGKLKHIGYFHDPKEAHEAYLEMKRKNHPTCSI